MLSKRRTLLLLDSLMLAAFLPLISWRITGLAWHERLGLALIALIVVHLLLHWSWVETHVAEAVQRSRARAGGLLLNAALFVSMGATLISGVVISKVVAPNRLTPGTFLKWHGVHETATTLTLVFLGMHLALNWDRITVALRTAGAGWRLLPARAVLRHAVSLALSVGLLTAVVAAYVSVLPGGGKILVMYQGGRQELRDPPAEITRAGPRANEPAPTQALGRVIMSVVLLTGTAFAGRRLVTRRRRRRHSMAASVAETAVRSS